MTIPWDELFEFLLLMIEKCDDAESRLRTPGMREFLAIRRAVRVKTDLRGSQARAAASEMFHQLREASEDEISGLVLLAAEAQDEPE